MIEIAWKRPTDTRTFAAEMNETLQINTKR